MSTVKLISGRIIEGVKLTNVAHVGDEGSRRATALIDGKEYPVYNSIVDGFSSIWNEQISFETYHMLKDTISQGVVESSVPSNKE